MADQLQLRGGTTTEHSTFVGAAREVTVDTTKNTLVVHDGVTPGGHVIRQLTDTEVINAVKTLDGVGSGVDADLLDGEHGAYYQPASTAITKDTDTGAAFMPSGDVLSRPSVNPVGAYAYIRYNSEYAQWEGSPDGSTWSGLGGATGGAGNPAFYENDSTITADYTITAGKNAMTAGPVTIEDGVTITVPDNSTWSIV